MKSVPFRIVLVVVAVAVAWGALYTLRKLPSRSHTIATSAARRGDILVRSYARGELRAAHSATLVAPNLFGTVQVTRLAPLGAFVHAGDVIAEFDASEVKSRLEEKQLEVEQTSEQIRKAEADLQVRADQDEVDRVAAQFGVRRAELEVKRNELLSPIDAKKNVLSLDEARQRLKQLESDIQSRQAQAQAQLAVLREKKNKGGMELGRERTRLAQVTLVAPMSGVVAIKQNATTYYYPGMQVPDIQVGDQLNPGIPVADILDMSEMELVARVSEIDRANLQEHQNASARFDAAADRKIPANIKSLSSTGTASIYSGDPQKKFDVVFAIDMRQVQAALGGKLNRASAQSATQSIAIIPASSTTSAPVLSEQPGDAVLRPGLLADIEIIVDKVPNAIYVPSESIFEKDGRFVVYVQKGSRFEERVVTPLKRTESTMIIAKGLEPGEIVALSDPFAKKEDSNKKAPASDGVGALRGAS